MNYSKTYTSDTSTTGGYADISIHTKITGKQFVKELKDRNKIIELKDKISRLFVFFLILKTFETYIELELNCPKASNLPLNYYSN
jgi:hypothetical protein